MSDLSSGKVLVAVYIWHGSQHIGQGPTLGSQKRRLKNYTFQF